MNKLLLGVFTFFYCVISNAQTALTTNQMSDLYKTKSFNQISVHDPSVLYNSKDGYYYIYGSHYYGAKSKDLRNWSAITNYYNTTYDKAFKSSPSRTVKRKLNGVVEEVAFPSFDAAAWCATYASNNTTNGHTTTETEWVSGDQWAPDIVWNPTMKKWCYYMSLNGDYWASVIVLMTSDNITGPFKYQGPVIMGGFIGSNTDSKNTKKIAPPSYKNSDLEIVLGTQSSLPSKYNKGNSNGTYWPNCIDPCAFFDESGELWLTYGSWSGGIFIIKLDKETGLRDYTYTFPNTNAGSANCTSDQYFGKKIAGGYYVSGEGPYIQHFGNYYYLFISYGFFGPDGGYEMRVFRSSNPDGPYKDASGVAATYTDLNKYVLNYGKNAATNRGMKLIGAMNGWGNMTVGECAQGHNSACSDDKGRNFLVCHTKFNNGTAGHSVRSYQLYLNKEGWLVTAPFQFAGETVTDDSIANGCPFTSKEIEGDYHVLLHPYKLDHTTFAEATPSTIHLSADGKVTGAYSGTWTLKDGTSYFTIKLGSYTYSGVLTEQTLENNTAKVIAFTTVNCTSGSANCGVPVWGYKLAPKSAIAMNYLNNSSTAFKVSSILSVSKNLNIMFDPVENTTLTWTSSNPDVISNTGKYNPQSEAVSLTMTARLECGDYYWENVYNSKAAKAADIQGDPMSGLVAYYTFDETPVVNLYDKSQTATLARSASSTKSPVLTNDYARFGMVNHQYFGAQNYNSYTRMANPLSGAESLSGFTVSMWVKRTDSNAWDALWSFFDGATASASGPRLFFTGNSYIGFNDNNGNWFDINHPDKKVINSIKPGEWHLVTFTMSKENGCKLYLDGTAYYSTNMVWNASTSAANTFDYTKTLDFVKSAKYFYLGLGSFWGSADACFDDLMIYNRELSAADVKGLNTALNRVNDFSPEGVVAVDEITVDTPSEKNNVEGIFDLMGRKVYQPGKGIYIVNGKKVKF